MQYGGRARDWEAVAGATSVEGVGAVPTMSPAALGKPDSTVGTALVQWMGLIPR